MTQKERMLTGKLYTWDEELARDHARKDELCRLSRGTGIPFPLPFRPYREGFPHRASLSVRLRQSYLYWRPFLRQLRLHHSGRVRRDHRGRCVSGSPGVHFHRRR